MDFLFCSEPRDQGTFLGGKSTEVTLPAVYAYLRLPRFAWPAFNGADTDMLAGTVAMRANILAILSVCAFSKIAQPIVGTISVNVVNLL